MMKIRNIVPQKADSPGDISSTIRHQMSTTTGSRKCKPVRAVSKKSGTFTMRFRNVVERQIGVLGLVTNEPDIGREQRDAEHPGRRVAEYVFGPADAVIDDAAQDDDAANGHQRAQGRVTNRRRRRSRQTAQAELRRLDIDDVKQRAIGEKRRQERVLDDVGVGDADIFGDQEGRRAHHRRHQLSVDAGGASIAPAFTAE